LRESIAVMSQPRAPPLPPKLPPCGCAMKRTLFDGRLCVTARASAMWNCDWKLP